MPEFFRTFWVVLAVHFALAWLLTVDPSWTRKTPLTGITVDIGAAAPVVQRGLAQAVPAQAGGGAAKPATKTPPRQAMAAPAPSHMDSERPKVGPAAVPVPTPQDRAVSATPGAAAPAIPQGQAQVEQETVRTYEPDVQAAYKENPKPPYPKAAFRMGAEGTVVVQVEVSEDGAVNAVRVAQSSGNELLDQSALDTIKGWRFRSARKDGAMSRSVVKVPITFRLRGR